MKTLIIICALLIASGFLLGLQGTIVLIGFCGFVWVLLECAKSFLGVD